MDLNIRVLSASLPFFEVFSACNGTEVPREKGMQVRENLHMGTAEYTRFSLWVFFICSKMAMMGIICVCTEIWDAGTECFLPCSCNGVWNTENLASVFAIGFFSVWELFVDFLLSFLQVSPLQVQKIANYTSWWNDFPCTNVAGIWVLPLCRQFVDQKGGNT